jgi:hypothetical protein
VFIQGFTLCIGNRGYIYCSKLQLRLRQHAVKITRPSGVHKGAKVPHGWR